MQPLKKEKDFCDILLSRKKRKKIPDYKKHLTIINSNKDFLKENKSLLFGPSQKTFVDSWSK